MQGMEGEAVVYHREIRHNEADAVRSARLRVKDAGVWSKNEFFHWIVGSFYE